MVLVLKPVTACVFGASWWLRDFCRGWLIKKTVRELGRVGGGYVIERRGQSSLEVSVRCAPRRVRDRPRRAAARPRRPGERRAPR